MHDTLNQSSHRCSSPSQFNRTSSFQSKLSSYLWTLIDSFVCVSGSFLVVSIMIVAILIHRIR